MKQPETYQTERFAEPAATTPGGPAIVVPLGIDRSVTIARDRDAATLSIRAEGGRDLQIEVRFGADGPLLRVQAPQVEVDTPRSLSLTCDTFSVDARHRIDLRAGGDITQTAGGNARLDAQRVDVEASPGAIRLKANDEVQALGEMILLNCDHPRNDAPMPAWTTEPRVIAEAPAESASGNESVIAELLRRRAGP